MAKKKNPPPRARRQKAPPPRVAAEEAPSPPALALNAANVAVEAVTPKAAAPPDPPSVPISDFFANVSRGLITAQKNLDNQSAAYLDAAATQPHVLPSIFRIPKVSAEMKFALDTTKTSGFDLLFFQDQTKAEEQHQQTIQFDIVASPPPPNLVAAPALAGIVRVKSDRQTIQTAVVLPAGVTDFDRVIILELIDTLQNAAAGTGVRQFVLFYADSTGVLGGWAIQIPMGVGTPGPTGTILGFGPAAPALATLQAFLSSAGDRQKTFLVSLS